MSYIKNANKSLIKIIQIETKTALENVNEIASIVGVVKCGVVVECRRVVEEGYPALCRVLAAIACVSL